jgi:hypothetical protein
LISGIATSGWSGPLVFKRNRRYAAEHRSRVARSAKASKIAEMSFCDTKASLNLLRATPEPELRLCHVDRCRFSAIMCRKFAGVTVFFWHLPDARAVEVGVRRTLEFVSGHER